MGPRGSKLSQEGLPEVAGRCLQAWLTEQTGARAPPASPAMRGAICWTGHGLSRPARGTPGEAPASGWCAGDLSLLVYRRRELSKKQPL